MWADKKTNNAIFEQLMDLKKRTNDEERYGIGRNSAIQSCIRKKDMMLDILPNVYQMIHPEVREINIQLFDTYEKHVFLTALELMVLFDIKIKLNDSGDILGQNNIPQFEPDISSIVTFGAGKKFQNEKYKPDVKRIFMK